MDKVTIAKRSLRRAAAERAKVRIAREIGWIADDPRLVGLRARSRKACPGACCKQPRYNRAADRGWLKEAVT